MSSGSLVFISGLLITGAEVIDIGIVPTPTNYFSMYFLNTDAAIIDLYPPAQ